jgi:hypothetical protein
MLWKNKYSLHWWWLFATGWDRRRLLVRYRGRDRGNKYVMLVKARRRSSPQQHFACQLVLNPSLSLPSTCPSTDEPKFTTYKKAERAVVFRACHLLLGKHLIDKTFHHKPMDPTVLRHLSGCSDIKIHLKAPIIVWFDKTGLEDPLVTSVGWILLMCH